MLRFLLLLALLALPGSANPASKQLIKGTDTFLFTYSAEIPTIESSGRIWLPIASSDSNQKVELLRTTAHKPTREVKDTTHGNRILVMDLTPEDSGKNISLLYKVTRHENTGHPAPETENTKPFLKADSLVPLTPEIRAIALEQTANAATAAEKANALYLHTFSRMTYDKSGIGWGRGDALHACDSRTGNCSDFHAYFIALARSIGIPARFAIGFTIPADTDSGTISGYHCWAEYLADGRWHPVDISEADKHPDLVDYYASNHPANRFQLSKGRDLTPAPLPDSGPINFLVYPLVESDGKLIDAGRTFSFERIHQSNP